MSRPSYGYHGYDIDGKIMGIFLFNCQMQLNWEGIIVYMKKILLSMFYPILVAEGEEPELILLK